MCDERQTAAARYKLIRYYGEMLLLARKFKPLLESGESNDVTRAEAERKAMLSKIHGYRDEQRSFYKQPYKDRERSRIIARIERLLGTADYKARNRAYVKVGGPVSAMKEKKTGHSNYYITVGYMWLRKVWEEIYTDDDGFSPWLILSADRVKVNHRLINVYEVRAFNQDTGETTSGYVAVTKKGRKQSFFALQAVKAIRGAEAAIASELDNLLKGTENDSQEA